MKCHIAKDLLPNQIEGLNSEETKADLQKHLTDCIDCRKIYENMTSEITQQLQPEDQNIDFLKRLKSAIWRRHVRVAIVTCFFIIAGLGGLLAYMFCYEMQVSYEAGRTDVKISQIGILEAAGEDGLFIRSWRVLGEDEPEEGELVRDELTIATYNIPHHQQYVYGKNISRNGEPIRVVYYCYTQTPFIRLLYKYSFYDNYASGHYYGSELHGDDFEPKRIEVYYLPDLFKYKRSINGITDEEYDAARKSGTLVWSGVI